MIENIDDVNIKVSSVPGRILLEAREFAHNYAQGTPGTYINNTVNDLLAPEEAQRNAILRERYRQAYNPLYIPAEQYTKNPDKTINDGYTPTADMQNRIMTSYLDPETSHYLDNGFGKSASLDKIAAGPGFKNIVDGAKSTVKKMTSKDSLENLAVGSVGALAGAAHQMFTANAPTEDEKLRDEIRKTMKRNGNSRLLNESFNRATKVKTEEEKKEDSENAKPIAKTVSKPNPSGVPDGAKPISFEEAAAKFKANSSTKISSALEQYQPQGYYGSPQQGMMQQQPMQSNPVMQPGIMQMLQSHPDMITELARQKADRDRMKYRKAKNKTEVMQELAARGLVTPHNMPTILSALG